MNTWTDVAGAFAQAGLSAIGTALGGPLGGAVGGLLGQAAAAALGVEPTPQAVQAAIERDPQGAASKLSAVEGEASAYLELEAKMLAEVNATYREEMRGDRVQRWWRPVNGYALALLVFAYGTAVVTAAFRGVFLLDAGALDLMTALLNGVGNMTLLLTPLGAVAGVAAWSRGREKIAALVGSRSTR